MTRKRGFQIIVFLLSFELFSFIIIKLESVKKEKYISSNNKPYFDSSWVYSPYYGFHFNNQSEYVYDFNKKDSEFVIGVLGGSVASDLAENFSNKIVENFPKNKKYVVIPLSSGGYKQPMQLFKMQFSMLSGVKFDMIISLDGYNEAVFTYQNIEMNINPIYPSIHHILQISKHFYNNFDLHDAKYLIEKKNYLTKINLLNSKKFKYPFSLRLALDISSNYYTNKLKTLITNYNIKNIKSINNIPKKYLGTDLIDMKIDSPTVYTKNLWKNSAIMANTICKNKDIPYFHFVQPNQYVPNTKTFTEFEREVCYKPDNYNSKRINEIYPLIKLASCELKKEFPTYDLTNIFKNCKETVYNDDCCHLNKLGNEIMAFAIADSILKFNEKKKVFE